MAYVVAVGTLVVPVVMNLKQEQGGVVRTVVLAVNGQSESAVVAVVTVVLIQDALRVHVPPMVFPGVEDAPDAYIGLVSVPFAGIVQFAGISEIEIEVIELYVRNLQEHLVLGYPYS